MADAADAEAERGRRPTLLLLMIISGSRIIKFFRAGDSLGVLARGATSSLAAKIVCAAITFAVQATLARLLGVTGYGVYAAALAGVQVLVVVSLLGFDTSLVRLVPEYRARKAWPLLRGALTRAVQAIVLASLAVATAWALALNLGNQPPELFSAFLCATFLVPVQSLLILCSAALRGLRRVVLSTVGDGAIRPLVTLALTGAFLLITYGPPEPWLVVLFHLGGAGAALIVCALCLGVSLSSRLRGVRAKFRTPEWLRISLPLLMMSSINVILSQTGVLLLSKLAGPEEAGLYAAAARIGNLAVFGLAAANAIAAPLISELYHTDRRSELQRVVTAAARGGFAYTAAAVLPLALLGEPILAVFGDEFVSAHEALLIVLAAQAVNAAFGPAGYLMSMTGHQLSAAGILFVGAVMNIGITIVMIPVWGVTGAAVGTAAGIMFWNIAMFGYVRRKIGLNSSVLSRFRPG